MTIDTQHDRSPAWNAGGWFGSQIGSTLWMAISAALLMPRSLAAASIVFALFLAVNLVGIMLWRRRSRMSISWGMQIWLFAFWLGSMAAIFAIDRAGLWKTLVVGGGNNMPASWTYVILTVLVLAGGLMFSLRSDPESSPSAGGIQRKTG